MLAQYPLVQDLLRWLQLWNQDHLKHQNNQFPHMDQQGRQRLVHLRKIPLHPSDRQQQEQWPGMYRGGMVQH